MYILFKRCFDFLFSAILLLLFSPFIVVITIILLCIFYPSSPFFVQSRLGKNNIPFKIIKFKTMRDTYDSRGNLNPDNLRVTPFGSFLRKYSIDELPQLLNILIGDMSFIGPRPLLSEYIKNYNSFNIQRHNVRPGMSGWAQINGRNCISWNEKFVLDVYYVKNISFLLDIKIFYKTFFSILFSKNINSSTLITMEKFNGKN